MGNKSSIETLIEQVVMGTYKNGEDKILYKTLPQSMIDHCIKLHKEEIINFTEDWYFNGPLLGEGIDVKNTIEQHFNETYGGGEQ
jgi:hypothetical protein